MADADIAPELAQVHANTRAVYQAKAADFDKHRAKMLFEQSWLDRFLDKLPHGPEVLDLGCGSGDPIDRYLMDTGSTITGVDCAPAMIEEAKRHLPEATWMVGDMRVMDFDRHFDGVLSWNGFFHLSRREQRLTLPKMASWVRPGGALLLTIGPGDGEGTGTVQGKPVYHASLSINAYTAILNEAGFAAFDHVLEDPACNFHSVLLASDKKTTD